MFATRPSYDDAASQRAVVSVLRSALRDEAFLKAFAGALVRYEGPWASAQVPRCLNCEAFQVSWRNCMSSLVQPDFCTHHAALCRLCCCIIHKR